MEILLDKGEEHSTADHVNAVDRWGRSALMYAVENRQAATARLLLERGAAVNSKTPDAATALHIAAYSGGKAIVKELLERGANVDSKVGGNITPLCIAKTMCYRSVMRLLHAERVEDTVNSLERKAKEAEGEEDTAEQDTNGPASLIKRLHLLLSDPEIINDGTGMNGSQYWPPEVVSNGE